MKNASLIKTLLVLSCLYSSTYAQKNKAIYSVIINNKEEITKSPYYSYYKIAQENGELTLQSGKQELFENIINQYI